MHEALATVKKKFIVGLLKTYEQPSNHVTQTSPRELVMQKAVKIFKSLCIAMICSSTLKGMVFDNRYIPLLQRPLLIIDNSWSEFESGVFLTTANSSYDQHQQEIPLPEIFGKLNQAKLGRAFVLDGQPNPLPTEFQTVPDIPWIVTGKRQSQGVVFKWHQAFTPWLSTGFSWLFMRVNSAYAFILDKKNTQTVLEPGDVILLTDNLEEIFTKLNLNVGNTTQTGFGDIDWYLRFGHRWTYEYRFRTIDIGLRTGVLFPTGQTREPDRPASIPFGGNGFWGAYVQLDTMFELKEDWQAGVFVRASKRFKKIRAERLPVNEEPQPFGIICGPVEINPGVTAVLCPWFLLQNLRGGLALGLNYTLTWHEKDSWCDKRSNQTTPINLNQVNHFSKWSSDYFTINALYDFGSIDEKYSFHPVAYFRWDVPSSIFVADRVNKTQRVTLGLEFVY